MQALLLLFAGVLAGGLARQERPPGPYRIGGGVLLVPRGTGPRSNDFPTTHYLQPHPRERMLALYAHSSTTFPEFPLRIASNPFSKSRYEYRCVITGRISRPDSSITVILYQVSYISRP